MPVMPTQWGAVCLLVFVLGLKHGLDADHLATIDGMTRYNQRERRAFARYCGALFSLGHGAVVVAVALSVAQMRRGWVVPGWLELSGAWIAILCLLVLAGLNLRAVLAAQPGQLVAPVGIKGRLLGRCTQASRPLAVVLVGALFAVSFDTISQSTLFALTAVQFGGMLRALLLGLLFAAGMVTTDAVNGLWIARLIARADSAALIASRVMSLLVAGVSLLVAAMGLAALGLPALGRWIGERDLAFGLTLCVLMAIGYACARRLAREARPEGLTSR